MSKTKFLITLIGIVIITVSILIFIKNSNDHKECSTEIKISKNNKGEKVKVEKHNCKEKYSF